MATQTISGRIGNASGGGPPAGGISADFYYTTGWTDVPLGSRVTGFTATYSASVSGVGLSGPNYAYTYAYWPASNSETVYGSGDQSAEATSPTPSTDVIFSGDPGAVGRADAGSDDNYYATSWLVSATSSGTLTFDPPSAKNLFFGTMG